MMLDSEVSECYLSKLAECETINEIVGHLVVTNEPLKIFLKDTISERTTELVDDSVET